MAQDPLAGKNKRIVSRHVCPTSFSHDFAHDSLMAWFLCFVERSDDVMMIVMMTIG